MKKINKLLPIITGGSLIALVPTLATGCTVEINPVMPEHEEEYIFDPTTPPEMPSEYLPTASEGDINNLMYTNYSKLSFQSVIFDLFNTIYRMLSPQTENNAKFKYTLDATAEDPNVNEKLQRIALTFGLKITQADPSGSKNGTLSVESTNMPYQYDEGAYTQATALIPFVFIDPLVPGSSNWLWKVDFQYKGEKKSWNLNSNMIIDDVKKVAEDFQKTLPQIQSCFEQINVAVFAPEYIQQKK